MIAGGHHRRARARPLTDVTKSSGLPDVPERRCTASRSPPPTRTRPTSVRSVAKHRTRRQLPGRSPEARRGVGNRGRWFASSPRRGPRRVEHANQPAFAAAGGDRRAPPRSRSNPKRHRASPTPSRSTPRRCASGIARPNQARVAEFLAALAVPAEVAALPAKPVTQHLVVTWPHGRHDHARPVRRSRCRSSRRADRAAAHPRRMELAGAGPVAPSCATSHAVARGADHDHHLLRIDEVSLSARRPSSATGPASQPVRPAEGLPTPRTLEGPLVGLLARARAPSLGFVDDQVPDRTPREPSWSHRPTGAPVEHVARARAHRAAAGCPARADDEAIFLFAIICAQVGARC